MVQFVKPQGHRVMVESVKPQGHRAMVESVKPQGHRQSVHSVKPQGHGRMVGICRGLITGGWCLPISSGMDFMHGKLEVSGHRHLVEDLLSPEFLKNKICPGSKFLHECVRSSFSYKSFKVDNFLVIIYPFNEKCSIIKCQNFCWKFVRDS